MCIRDRSRTREGRAGIASRSAANDLEKHVLDPDRGWDPVFGSDHAQRRFRMSTVINCVTYEAGRRRAELDLKEACPADSAGNFTWVGLHEPNKELLRTVQQRFVLH